MKFIFLALLLLSPLAEAKKANPEALVKQLTAKRSRLLVETRTNPHLVNFHMSPENPLQGDSVYLFLEAGSAFKDYEILVEGKLDGSPVTLEQPAKELWIFTTGTLKEIRSHEFSASVSVQSKKDARQIRDALTVLESEIADLNEQIENETDQQLKDALIAQRDKKEALKGELLLALKNLKRPLGEEKFSFSIAAHPTSPDIPRITQVDPAVGPQNLEQQIVVRGENFEASPEVKVGSYTASVLTSSATEIQLLLPAISDPGPKDVEVRFNNGEVKNAIQKNGFVVVANLPSKPVAFATAVSDSIAYGAPAEFQSTGSFDPNNQPIRYEWKLVSRPSGSNLPLNGTPETTENYSFQPDAPGFYAVELKVFTTSLPLETSEPSLAVVEVQTPANHSPQASAPAIVVSTNGTATSQITVTDEDGWQSHGYFIKTQGTQGTASVSSSGLVTYTAGSSNGSDLIQVLVVDSGSPQAATTVSIPVTLNIPPVVTGPFFRLITSADDLYHITLDSGEALSDPDGSIAKVEWDIGGFATGVDNSDDLEFAFIEFDLPTYGDYPVTLKVTDNQGAVTTRTETIHLGNVQMPVAKASLDTISGATPLTVNFAGTLVSDPNGVNSVRWRYGDGTAEEKGGVSFLNRTHTFQNPGTYTVRYRVRDPEGTQVTHNLKVYAGTTPPAGGAAPISFLRVPQRNRILTQAHSFDGSASFDYNPGAGALAYNWRFEDDFTCPTDGCTATGVSASHTYTELRNYFPNLTVVGSGGTVSDTRFTEVFVVNAGLPPRAFPQATQVEGVAPFTLNADKGFSFDYDGTLSGYDWWFGDFTACPTDGCLTSGTSVQHTYTDPGVYLPTLTVTDNDGNKSFKNLVVTVYPNYQAMAKNGKKAIRPLEREDGDEREEARRILGSACASGAGAACYQLAAMYLEDGDTYTAEKLNERACSLGHQPACPAR